MVHHLQSRSHLTELLPCCTFSGMTNIMYFSKMQMEHVIQKPFCDFKTFCTACAEQTSCGIFSIAELPLYTAALSLCTLLSSCLHINLATTGTQHNVNRYPCGQSHWIPGHPACHAAACWSSTSSQNFLVNHSRTKHDVILLIAVACLLGRRVILRR